MDISFDTISQYITFYGLRIIIALAIFFVGRMAARWLSQLCERAMQLNPFGKYNWNLGLVKFVARDYDEAVRLLSNLANPTVTVLALLAASLARAGRHADARQTTQRFLDLCKRTPLLKSIAGGDELRAFFDERWPFSRSDDTDHMMQAMREAGFEV